jgi:hypothetical protein
MAAQMFISIVRGEKRIEGLPQEIRVKAGIHQIFAQKAT